MKYLIKTENDKIVGTYFGDLEEVQMEQAEKDGFFEIDEEQGKLLNIDIPQKFVGGKVVVDKKAKAEKDRQFELNNEIAILESQLISTDYVVLKIAEGVATAEEYADTIAERAKWRERINAIQKELEL